MTDYRIGDLPATLTDPAPGDLLAAVDVSDKVTEPADDSGSTKELPLGTLAQFAARCSAADVKRVFTAGHSYPAGYNPDGAEGAAQAPMQVAGVLHAEEVTYAQTSAVLATDDGSGHPGGYASAWNGIVPRVASGSSYSPRNGQPYLCTSPVNVLWYGFNDLTYLNSTVATAVAWFKMALRALCCGARAGGYFPDTDASVAYGGSGGSHWTANTGQGQVGSPSNHSTTTANDTVTISVPSTFPGGEVDLITLALGGGTKWSTVADSGSAQVLDGTSSAFGSASGRANLVVQRLTGLAAGSHTIIMTMISKDSGATAVFDSWLIAAPAAPVTVLPNQPAAPCLPLTTGGLHSPVTGTDVTSLNTAVSDLAAEFTDGSVIVGDIAAAFAAAGGNAGHASRGSLYASDDLHFTTAGHALAAAVILAAIRSAPLPLARFSSAGVLMRQVQENGAAAAWPNGGEPAFSSGWSGLGGSPPTAFFAKAPGGRAELNLVLTGPGSPAAGDVIFNLGASGYAPAAEVILTALSWDPDFTDPSPALVGVRPGGDVVWYAGDPTTLLQVSGSYYAGAPGA